MANDDKVSIFIDGSNLYHSLKGSANRSDLDFSKFAAKLVGDRKLVRIYYYNAPVDQTIATDMLVHGTRRNYDIAILVSGDTDFTDALQAVKDLRWHYSIPVARKASEMSLTRLSV